MVETIQRGRPERTAKAGTMMFTKMLGGHQNGVGGALYMTTTIVVYFFSQKATPGFVAPRPQSRPEEGQPSARVPPTIPTMGSTSGQGGASLRAVGIAGFMEIPGLNMCGYLWQILRGAARDQCNEPSLTRFRNQWRSVLTICWNALARKNETIHLQAYTVQDKSASSPQSHSSGVCSSSGLCKRG